jgi:hypothetical protein
MSVEFIGSIVVCPVCSTSEDALAEGWQDFECSNCETQFKILIEAEKAAAFGMFG